MSGLRELSLPVCTLAGARGYLDMNRILATAFSQLIAATRVTELKRCDNSQRPISVGYEFAAEPDQVDADAGVATPSLLAVPSVISRRPRDLC